MRVKNTFSALLFILALVLSTPVLACKCMNEDIHELYKKSDTVILGTGQGDLVDDRQKLNVKTLIKGEIPEGGLFVSQQKSSCNYNQLPLGEHYQEYLLMLETENGEYKFTATCYNYYNNNGYYSLRLSPMGHAHVHSTMVPAFLRNKGEIPELSLYFSIRKEQQSGKIENWLSLTNQSDKALEIFHPSNRRAFTFHIVDDLGNIVTPQGIAKVDPMGGVLDISEGGAFNYDLNANNMNFFPFLTDSALFGYPLETGKTYTVSVTYRPYGGKYGTITSEERDITIYD